MTRERAADPIGFGSGISTDHKDGIRWVDYSNISWNPVFCKRCDICVEICPKDTLVLRNDAIIEEQNCILCGLCERYCPDIAIEMLPEALAAHASKDLGGDGPESGAGARGRHDGDRPHFASPRLSAVTPGRALGSERFRSAR